ncbi:hypothetical protein RFI_37710 [Reticulomyxa filosa]|uniref:Uncharacterized protein n=1 Tax=Reticulomyxa filosa TaxID=46433 RepID=X6LCK3_RETFI|nr:hypothetical protein RFI_37710 [Reticulomyxa filosa]|eukprot:ETN99757.1 hypothetical protein RFI_37710 [Reticulomyxa filosa]
MWNHQIDANLIYIAIRCCKKNVNLTMQLLTVFEQWKFLNNNKQKYKARMNEFLERRCCNHNINLFCIFICEAKILKGNTAIEIATSETIKHKNSSKFTKQKPFVIQKFLFSLINKNGFNLNKNSKQK